MLEVDGGRDARLRRKQFLRGARRRSKKVTVPPGVAAAMARMNGRCQITSPMPGFTWMTAVGFTLIARQKVAIWHL